MNAHMPRIGVQERRGGPFGVGLVQDTSSDIPGRQATVYGDISSAALGTEEESNDN